MNRIFIFFPDSTIREVIQRSIKAREQSYCPYSNFRVGAALLCEDGTIYNGCNVENASYTVGICAERTAVVKAVSEGKRKFTALAVASSMGNTFATPCGACRQFIVEFGENLDIYLTKPDGQFKKTTIRELLPYAFCPSTAEFDKFTALHETDRRKQDDVGVVQEK